MMIARSIFALAFGLLWFVSMPAAARADDCASSSACPAQTDPAPTPKPSFDCTKATTAVEKAICSDPVLANWDRNMAAMFSLILAGARLDTRKTVLAAQNAWLSQLSNCVPVVPAPEPVMIGEPLSSMYGPIAPPKTMSSCLLDAYQRYDHDVTPRLKFLAEGLKFPFLPRLTFSNGDALCRKFLDGAIIDYETVRDQPEGDKDPHIIVTGGRWIDWNWGNGGVIAAERVDLDGKGQPSLLIETQAPGPGALEDINLYVQTTADPDLIIHNIAIIMTDNVSDLKSNKMVEIDSERLFGSPDPHILPSIFLYDGHYYRFHKEESRDIPFMGHSVFSLDRIHADGSLDPTCRVSYYPEIKGLAQTQTPSDVQKSSDGSMAKLGDIPQSVSTLFDIIDKMQGIDTEHYPSPIPGVTWQKASSRAAQYKLIVRPWDMLNYVLPYADKDRDAPSIEAKIVEWGFQGYSNYRVLRDLIDSKPKALDELATFYQTRYGLSRERSVAMAKSGFATLLISSFTFHVDDLYTGPDPLDRQTIDPKRPAPDIPSMEDNPSMLLARALLVGLPSQQVGPLIDQVDPIKSSVGEPWLVYAIEHPDLMKLLIKRGASINQANGFGKTPLMYAAQANLPDSVALLLAHRANVTGHTAVPNDPWDYAILHDHRTALMYAAENASPNIINALLDAGASPNDRDTQGLAPIDYFQLNPIHSGPDGPRVSAALAPTNKH